MNHDDIFCIPRPTGEAGKCDPFSHCPENRRISMSDEIMSWINTHFGDLVMSSALAQINCRGYLVEKLPHLYPWWPKVSVLGWVFPDVTDLRTDSLTGK